MVNSRIKIGENRFFYFLCKGYAHLPQIQKSSC
jgi:hypothetical protein